MGARNKRTRTANDMRGLEISDMSHYPWCLNQGRPLRRKNPWAWPGSLYLHGAANEPLSISCCCSSCIGGVSVSLLKAWKEKILLSVLFLLCVRNVQSISVVVIFSRVYVRFPDVVNIYGLDNIVYLQRTITQWINC